MAATSRQGFNAQTPGTNAFTWGNVQNTQLIELVDEATAGVETIPVNGNLTLTSDNFISNQARNLALVFTPGTATAATTITIPAREHVYIVRNASGQALTFTADGATGVLPTGRWAIVLCDGANVLLFDAVALTDAIRSASEAARDQAQRWAEASDSPDGTASKSAKTWAGQASTSASSAASAQSSASGFASAASNSASTALTQANRAQGFANGLNMPPVTISDAGALLAVKPDGSGFETTGSVNIVQSVRTSDQTIVAADKGNLVYYSSGTFTQTITAAATLKSGWWCYLRNGGTGVITIDPNGSETVDGRTTIRLYPRETIILECIGFGFRTIGRANRFLIADQYVSTSPSAIDFESFAGDSELKFLTFDVYGVDDSTSLAVQLKRGGAYISTNYNRQAFIADNSSVSANYSTTAVSCCDHATGSFLSGAITDLQSTNCRVRAQAGRDNRFSMSCGRHPTTGLLEGLRFAVAAGALVDAQFRLFGER